MKTKLKFLVVTSLLTVLLSQAQTQNYVAKFISGVPKDSRIFDNGTSIGFGTSTPSFAFDSNLGYAKFSFPGAVNNRFFQIIPGYLGNGDIPAGAYISAGSNVSGEGLSLLPNGGGTLGVKLGAYVYAKNKWTSVWETQNENATSTPTLSLLKGGGWVNLGDINNTNADKTNFSLNGDIIARSDKGIGISLIQNMNIPFWDGKNKSLRISIPDQSWNPNGSAFIDVNGDNSNINNALYINSWSGRDTYINTGSWNTPPNNGGTVYLGKTRIGAKRPNGIHADAQLSVDGKVLAKSVYVNTTTWADYVFANDYKLPKLSDVETFYKENKHLPEIPSEKEVIENGVNVAEMNKLLLKKVEELTLYIVDQNKKIEELRNEINLLKK